MAVEPMLAAAQEQVRAAWVQAFGAIAAIIAAVAVPVGVYVAQRRAEANRSLTVARDHAIVVSGPLTRWRQVAAPHEEQLYQHGDLGAAMVIRTVIAFDALTTMPPTLVERVGRLHEFGPAAWLVQDLVARFNDLIDARVSMERYAEGAGLTEAQRARMRRVHTRTLGRFFRALREADDAVQEVLAPKAKRIYEAQMRLTVEVVRFLSRYF